MIKKFLGRMADKHNFSIIFQRMTFLGVGHSIQPKIFLFENVGGLLSARWTKNGNTNLKSGTS